MSATLHRYTLTGPAGQLEGVAHVPAHAPRAVAVVAHPLPTLGGSMDNKVATTLAKTLVELGCAALRFNFRGVGASEGVFTGGDGEQQDLLAVVEYAREHFGADLPLVLAGFSFGGYVAARAAQIAQPQHLVLAAPAVGRFAMPHVPAHTLVVHGEQDEVVSLADALAWAGPQHLPIVVLPAAGHFFHGRLVQLREVVKRHFNGVGL